jgi:hypothetical protein
MKQHEGSQGQGAPWPADEVEEYIDVRARRLGCWITPVSSGKLLLVDAVSDPDQWIEFDTIDAADEHLLGTEKEAPPPGYGDAVPPIPPGFRAWHRARVMRERLSLSPVPQADASGWALDGWEAYLELRAREAGCRLFPVADRASRLLIDTSAGSPSRWMEFDTLFAAAELIEELAEANGLG